MALIVEVISYLSVPQTLSARASDEDMTIGRNSENTLVLPDPDKFVSSRHAIIHYRAPDYVITDTSTNGVYVNQNPTPLGKGNSVELADGDQLAIGDYLVSVSISEDSEGPLDAPDEDPFADALPNDALSDSIVEFDADQIDRIMEENNVFSENSTRIYEDALSPASRNEMDNHGISEKRKNIPVEALPHLDHEKILNELNTTAIPAQGSTDIDHRELDCPILTTHNEHSEIAGQSRTNDDPAERDDVIESGDPKIRTVEARPNHDDNPVPDGRPIHNSILNQTRAENDSLIDHFLAGARLSPQTPLHPRTFRLIGCLLRESVKGLRDSLLGRSEIKNILNMEMTLIRPSENNPIKFSVSTEESLRKLLIPSGKGYLAPAQSIVEGFQDINAHQLAMLSAVQSTLKSFVKRFDPDTLQAQLQKQNPVMAKIPVLRQIKLWQLSQQLYEDLEFEAAERFMELFGPSFADAYDNEMTKFQRTSKTADPEPRQQGRR